MDNDTRLLFIMDSLSMRAITFVALGVRHVTVIDPRQAGSKEYFARAMEDSFSAVILTTMALPEDGL